MEALVFTDNSTVEFIKQENEKMGLSYEDFVSWIREPPNYTTFRVNTLHYTVKDALQLISENVAKTAIQINATRCPEVYINKDFPDVINVGSWDFSINDAPSDEVVVDAFCGAAILRGSHLFAPGVLALPKGTAVGQQVAVYADLDGKCLQGTATKYKGNKMLVGTGILELDREKLFNNIAEKPKGIAVRMTWTRKGILSFDYPIGMGQLQNLPSSAASWELNPLPGDLVLDMCASPGNKTSHLAALMNNEGVLVAIDRTEKKCNVIRETCDSFQAKCLAFCYDSSKSVLEDDEPKKKIEDGPPFNQNSFDKILLDAPCSALGQRPQLLNKISVKQIKSNPSLQKRIFKAAVKLLKPKGTLVYCTCSTTLEENEGVVQWALQEFQGVLAQAEARKRITPVVLLKNVPEDICAKVQRFGPQVGSVSEYCDSIGFFISRFVKI
ncbi:Hypothetical predicted protein [Cloeon dipterum]|uniref:SAM-dependent MTase RsmB/NOP-type domain-containing protein n=1 Tax=Cloeon dipterum TaxID=197152 RepID=A0A8S1CIV8_9INSE|nr:Hypothetical predicted protein [Cloeon dipterum]